MKRRYYLTFILFAVALSICLSVAAASFAQSLKGLVTAGASYDNILIGKSTESDVTAYYGADYKLINHNNYSFEIIYKNLGLSFYYCAADPNKEIFTVEIESPSEAETDKGIKLGESTFADVSRIYGDGTENYSEAEYDGIYFYSEEDNNEEDAEDARIEKKQPASDKEIAVESISEPLGERSDQSIIVLDGVDISEAEANKLLQAEKDQAELEKEKNRRKIVKRIELVENDGLRQCDSKFPESKK